jgi:hypothetical protein
MDGGTTEVALDAGTRVISCDCLKLALPYLSDFAAL